MSSHLSTQSPASAGTVEPSFDIVALSNKNRLNNKSATIPKTRSKSPVYTGPVIIKAPKNPQDHLLRYHKLTTAAKNHGCEHDLEAGFNDIWSAYKNRGHSAKTNKL
ncbi:hypothetical protein FHL15_000331 [Xylaria flabelliformis]|uniref:Uncharacterized protein n=1 Tax=Xylaria flabelliformis TaxID=2512241 RepID=A0A553IFL1_9PEZI|nr:hypothetical protein FHL15_000331 [Xylaria flabelliformis]